MAVRSGSEAAFQTQVLNLATLYDWSAYHTHDSRRSQPGFPDLVLTRAGDLIFAELKTETGRVRPEQARWLALLEQVQGIDVYLWRPSDFDFINQRLARGRHMLERAA